MTLNLSARAQLPTRARGSVLSPAAPNLLTRFLNWFAPEGYQDASGFHFGTEPDHFALSNPDQRTSEGQSQRLRRIPVGGQVNDFIHAAGGSHA